MKGVARISHPNGGLILPAKSPYEIELVIEHVGLHAKRHGRVRLELNRRDWLVTVCNGGPPGRCTGCAQRIETLTYANGSGQLCARCVRRELR
jgi:hypothetical protein